MPIKKNMGESTFGNEVAAKKNGDKKKGKKMGPVPLFSFFH